VVFSIIADTEFTKLKIRPNVTGKITKPWFRDMMTSARAVVPSLKTIVILGEPWERQTFYRNFPNEIPIEAADVEVIDLTGVPMRELRKRVAELSDNTAIIYTGILGDGEGTFYPAVDALAFIAETANRPIVIADEPLLERGGIGGFLQRPILIGDEAARLAMRVLDGEPASSIPITVANSVRPIFDWRQMQRWGVSEARLPPGSEVRFRPPSAWEQYYWQIMLIVGALLVQTLLIGVLFYERRRRRYAEATSRQRLSELAHLNRTATAGELSASIAHEVKQPLAAIATNSSAALRWLRRTTPDLDKAEASLERVVDAAHRASDVLSTIRSLFKKSGQEKVALDINTVIQEVLAILHGDFVRRRILVQTRLHVLPLVMANRVQLQQVILNLCVNAIDAMDSVTARNRVLGIVSERQPAGVLITVEDTGPGVESKNIDSLFEPFYTTKSNGMGMGLAICRSIVEDHGGRLIATPGRSCGLVMQIILLSATAHGGAQKITADAAE
jgi:signal transduction histidine kinase